MATGLVLPLKSRVEEWHNTQHNFRPCSTLNGSPQLLSSPMARPPPGAEPREEAYSQKPILPPLSKFLSDAGHPDLFAHPRSQHYRPDPLRPDGAALINHVAPSSSIRLHELPPMAQTESLPQPRLAQMESHNSHGWPYPNTSPRANHPPIPGNMMRRPSLDPAAGPAILREEMVPGRGLCYIYEDGTMVQKTTNGDAVNPKWGTTKAGKPRKRLGQACNTCREKKIKCDPSVPKCAQCQKFGRECRFDSTSRFGSRQGGSMPPAAVAPASTASSDHYASHYYASRRGSTASTDPVTQEPTGAPSLPRSSIQLDSLLSPASEDGHNSNASSDGGPPTKKLRVSLSPHLPSESWPSSSLASGSMSSSATMSSLTAPKFCWTEDPYLVERNTTIYYTNKYFKHVDSATSCILPRKAFLAWIKSCANKSLRDKMLLYAILAMGTVFAPEPESRHHQAVFIEIVNSAVIKSSDTFSLQLVQTKLILALFAFSQGQYNQAWDSCGSALRIAFGLRFNTEDGVAVTGDKNSGDFGFDYDTLRECRRRTFWSAYVMDCFNGCCSAPVTSVNRTDCRLRLPCSQSAYEEGAIPQTCFALDLKRTERDTSPMHVRELSEVGVLGYLVEIATIFNEVSARIGKSQAETSSPDQSTTESFTKDTLGRLEAWDHLMKKYMQQGRDGREFVNGLHILDHYTALILHRYVRYPDVSKPAVAEHVRGAYEHARLLLGMVQRLSNHQDKDIPSFQFATMSPFSGFAITAALDVITAAGTMADLMGHKSRMMSLISSGVEALEGLVDYWHSSRRQRDVIKQRVGILLTATNRASDFNGAFYFGQPMQSPFGLDQDIVYGLPRQRYFHALGWDERIHHEGHFRRLD